MNSLFSLLLGIGAAYLVGSIPTAYIIGRLYKGIDVRQHGSGNVGATNAFRVLGKEAGTAVLVIDILKGVVAVTVIGDILNLHDLLSLAILGVTAVIGHNWTVFLQFKGGKGIATTLGVLIGLAIKLSGFREVLFFSLGVWVIVFFSTGFVSLASILASICLPFFMVITNQSVVLTALGIILCLFVILRHRPNIQRLISGKENRVFHPFGPKKPNP